MKMGRTIARETFLGVMRLAALALTLAIFPATAGETSGETRTLKGELVDVRCYLTAGKRGADHAKCAMICVKDNLPVGLLTSDSKLYTLIIQPAAFGDFMSLQAEVIGTVHGDSVVPSAAKALKEGQWVEIKLPEQMM